MVRKHRSKAVMAIALALSASLASNATADPAPLARAEAVIAATHHSALVRQNPTEQTATPTHTSSGPCSEICSGGVASYRPTAGLAQTPTVVRVVAHSGGFQWADAGIGAGASVVLVGAGLAGMRAASNGRKRHIRERQAIATN